MTLQSLRKRERMETREWTTMEEHDSLCNMTSQRGAAEGFREPAVAPDK